MVAVVVVVEVVEVGAGVPVELHATDNRPTARAATPTVKDARLRTWAVFNNNGISLSSQSDYETARYIPTGRQVSGNRAAVGSLRIGCCQPAVVTGSIGRCRRAPGASAGTTGCSGGIGASRL